MNMESRDFERLRAAGVAIKAYRVEETPPELGELLVAALGRIIGDKRDAEDSS